MTCSTPFGIGGWITGGASRAAHYIETCSTPFGIGGWITWHQTSQWSCPCCAQRLSASEGGSPTRQVRYPMRPTSAQRLSASEGGSLRARYCCVRSHACSTPFGIGGWITPPPHALAPTTHGSAQRLSASEGGSPLPPWIRRVTKEGAQRLSASEGGSRGSSTAADLLETKCSTPFGIGGWITAS